MVTDIIRKKQSLPGGKNTDIYAQKDKKTERFIIGYTGRCYFLFGISLIFHQKMKFTHKNQYDIYIYALNAIKASAE
ncbi:hypothetical protein CO693_16315 [Morganella morganii]|nr:hypothetical protein CO693_16315 [Morganella morganii]